MLPHLRGHPQRSRIKVSPTSSPIRTQPYRVVTKRDRAAATHTLTAVVAQIRGLRVLQSMASTQGWSTKLGGYETPREVPGLLVGCFFDVGDQYLRLQRPPWEDMTPWGPQEPAGHATTHYCGDMFVGEHSDLLWRALTETDCTGLSPLKVKIGTPIPSVAWQEMRELVVAAALYDETAAYQLTHGLFDGAHWERSHLKERALTVLWSGLRTVGLLVDCS